MYKELAKQLINDDRLSYSVKPEGGDKVHVEIVCLKTWDTVNLTFVPYLTDGQMIAVYRHGPQTKTGEQVTSLEEMLECVKRAEDMLHY